MTGLHAISQIDASVGATAGTFDAIDTTRANAELVDDATRYYGFMAVGAPVAVTAGEAQSGRFRVTSASLDLVGEIWTYGAALGAGIATNNQGVFFPVEFIYLDLPAGGGETINSAFTTYLPDPTDAWSVIISQLHADKDKPPTEYFGFWTGGAVPPHQGGDSEDTTVSATTRTSVGAVTIEGKFGEVVGIMPNQVQDPVGTAGEESVGYLEITTGISGVEPAHYPIPAISPALGVAVVGGPIQHTPQWLPWWIRREKGKDRTIEPFVNLTTALTAANGITFSLAYKK